MQHLLFFLMFLKFSIRETHLVVVDPIYFYFVIYKNNTMLLIFCIDLFHLNNLLLSVPYIDLVII